MIGRLTGRLAECSPGDILLDVSGVGYALKIPLSTFYPLVNNDSETATLYVHTHVREDALSLYGFCTIEERSMFLHLVSIAGIGPKVALAILSGIGVEDLRRAVEEKDRARLQRIPGVGKKTAERMLLELGDRLRRTGRKTGGVPSESVFQDGAGTGIRADAVSALLNLGYSEEIAGRAVETALREVEGDPDLEVLLKSALGSLVK